jgi:endonuclease/exonuclease/phosphatase family metal-dependent hydrolase
MRKRRFIFVSILCSSIALAALCIFSASQQALTQDAVTAENKDIAVVDWNIQVGSDPDTYHTDWPSRKTAMRQVLLEQNPDLMCLQEALSGQLEYIRTEIPGFGLAGVGRDDGDQKGEYCCILYKTSRFTPLESGTFWLSDTPEKPDNTWDNPPYKRICSWVRLKDKITGSQFTVFNTHFPLFTPAKYKSARLVMDRINRLVPEHSLILTGDFNCKPDSDARRVFKQGGLKDIFAGLGRQEGMTYHVAGVGKERIDSIYVNPNYKVNEVRVLKQSINGRFPSDHFGLFARIEISPREHQSNSSSVSE